MVPQTSWTRTALRLFAWSLLFVALWGMAASSALADAPATDAEPDNFWVRLLENILTFNSRGLMELLGRPEYTAAALVAINLIVFVETGLLIGFFLPGDSLLVTAGLIASNPACGWSLPLLLI